MRSPIDLLLRNGNFDAAITNYIEDLNDQTANTPLKKMLRDVHAAARYYNRPEEQPQDPDTLAPPSPAAPAPPAKLDPDFHDRAAAACNVSALARALGLVVDVAVHQDDVAKLAQATRIWCDVICRPDRKVRFARHAVHDLGRPIFGPARRHQSLDGWPTSIG